jgi:prophage regulatory protein|tara:strand:+ start:870 stop:1133 length:264 start_codon:yes stop_codon:yes gene_type:complete
MKILRLSAVLEAIGYKSRTSLYTQINEGLFPKPISIGVRAVGIPDAEVEAVISHRINGASDIEIRALVAILHEKRKKCVAENMLGAK